jgi:O-antigen/teichoic acid export membrane protein
MSLSALMAFLRFSDLGLGNGLVGAISQAEGREDSSYAKRAISSVLVCLCIAAVVIIATFLISTFFIHWDAVLGLASLTDRSEVQTAIQVYVVIYAVGIPIRMAPQVQTAIQEGYISNMWMTAGNLLSLLGVSIAALKHAPIPWLVAAISGIPLIPSLANGIVLYFVQRPDLRPSLQAFEANVAKELLGKGSLFFGLGIAGALAFDSQNIVIAHVLGPSAVGVYAVVQRLYSMIPTIVGFVTAPLWPAFGEALGRREWSWISLALRRSVVANAVIASAFALVLFLFSGPILLHWTHGAISASKWLVAGFSVWAVTSAINSPLCMLLNAAHVLWFQIIFALLHGVMTVVSIFLILPILGLPGAVWAMTLLYLLVVLIPYSVKGVSAAKAQVRAIKIEGS